LKLSDYVAHFLSKQGIRHVFAVSGGASLHLIHSVAETPGITYVCPQHEQAGAMAADGYARATGNLGAAMVTSGPGATNLLTGVCCSYYDSVPVIYITGQVSTFRMKGDTGVRQVGFQETDTIAIYKSITKYAVLVDDPKNIRYELEKACYLAKSGRPGPVLVDIPDNVQREQINPDGLQPFIAEKNMNIQRNIHECIEQCIEYIGNAHRPVVILGWGIRLAKADKEVRELIDTLGFPVAPTWGIADLLPSSHPLLIGTFGTHGTRYANLAVQNADLILSIGSRLDTKATGSPITTFAREAKKIVVDIDPNELSKFESFGLSMDLLINADAKDFLQKMMRRISKLPKYNISEWLGCIAAWQEKYTICPSEYYEQEEVNPYVFVKTLSQEASEGDVICIDTGCTVAWMMQAFHFKDNQRLYHDWNNTAMGWALPASIGASFALDKRQIICVTGDGSLQMNIQELATIVRHELPIKIFLINNHGHSMIQQTQDQWLDSRYIASTVDGGLAFPDFMKVAEAYGFRTVSIDSNRTVSQTIHEVLNSDGPIFCNVEIKPDHRVIPQVKFGRPNEDPDPLLERKEFLANMLVKPLAVSLH